MAYEYLSALKYLRPASPHWRPEVKLCSALEGDGVGQVWEVMAEFRQKMEECGELEARRRRQHLRWMWRYVEERLVRMARDIGHHNNIEILENMVSRGSFWHFVKIIFCSNQVRDDLISPGAAADAIIQLLTEKIKTGS